MMKESDILILRIELCKRRFREKEFLVNSIMGFQTGQASPNIQELQDVQIQLDLIEKILEVRK